MGTEDKELIKGKEVAWTVTPSSPFYLASGDQPGNVITHITFTGDNYVSWARAMTISLRARRKFGFVEGKIPKPTDPMGELDWDTVQSMIVSWILRTMDSKISATVPLHENARDLWVYLERRFCVANGPRIQQIKAAISDCKQTGTMKIDEYYTKLVGLYDELARLNSLPSCECKKCECGIALKLSKGREEEVFHQFLVGPDNNLYGAVRTNLLSQQPLGDLNHAYQILIQEEQSRSTVTARETHPPENVQAFHVQTDKGKSRFDQVDKTKLLYTHCKRRGHDMQSCFKLIGNPPWYEERLRARAAGRIDAAGSGQISSGSLGGSGQAVGGSSSGPGASRVSAAAGRPAVGARANAVADGSFGTPESGGTPIASLTSDQMQVLINMISNEQNHSDRMAGMEWIIDTGASHHITGDLSCLVNVRNIEACSVGLPNGCSAFASMQGDVHLTDHLVLRDVLFVRDFNCHLIYVSHLLSDNDCSIQFTSSLCAIQDRPSGILIGAGERRGGIYFFREVAVVQAVGVSEVNVFDLWHQRLGYEF